MKDQRRRKRRAMREKKKKKNIRVDFSQVETIAFYIAYEGFCALGADIFCSVGVVVIIIVIIVIVGFSVPAIHFR